MQILTQNIHSNVYPRLRHLTDDFVVIMIIRHKCYIHLQMWCFSNCIIVKILHIFTNYWIFFTIPPEI